MSFNYSKLRGRIKEKFATQAHFAVELNISAASLSDKLNGKSNFSHKEIALACEKLDIPFDCVK